MHSPVNLDSTEKHDIKKNEDEATTGIFQLMYQLHQQLLKSDFLKGSCKRRTKKIVKEPKNPFERKNENHKTKTDKKQDDYKRRSFDILKVTRDECYACDATTQTAKKRKDFCNIC